MGIYIDGMEMPKGREIRLRIDEKGEVYVYGSYPTELHTAIPAAVVRPVVLCRDCIHARRYTNKIKCGYWSEQTASEIVCEDDFCSYGEKRGES